MSRNGYITLDWDGEEQAFRLGWGELEALQEATDCGPEYLFACLTNGTWKVGHIAHVFRQGLIGAGMEPSAATKRVNKQVKSKPPLRSLLMAIDILKAGISGAEDETPGEALAADQNETIPSQTGKSGSPPSTPMPGHMDGPSMISDSPASGNTLPA